VRSHFLIAPIPSETAKTARAILGRNNLFLMVGDSWESLMAQVTSIETEKDETSQNWMYPTLAVGTLLQYKEKLSDRQAEEASRLRVDWKYALRLSKYYPGLSRGMLCNYRQGVYHDPASQRDFQSILDRSIELGLFQECQEAPVTAVTLLDEVCTQSRLEVVMLALRRTLEVLATHHLKWLRNIILPDWYTRYHLFNAAPDLPEDLAGQVALTETIGADILYLTDALARSQQPELEVLDEIKALNRVWLEQFEPDTEGGVQRLARCSFCGSQDVADHKGS